MDTEYDRALRERLKNAAEVAAEGERQLGLAVAAARDVGWSWRAVSAATGIPATSHQRRHSGYRVEDEA